MLRRLSELERTCVSGCLSIEHCLGYPGCRSWKEAGDTAGWLNNTGSECDIFKDEVRGRAIKWWSCFAYSVTILVNVCREKIIK